MRLSDQNSDFCSFYLELKIKYVRHFLPYFLPTHNCFPQQPQLRPFPILSQKKGKWNYISEAKYMMVNAKHRRQSYITQYMSKTSVVESSECVPCNHAHSPTPIFSTLSLYPLRLCFLSPHPSVYLPSPS